MSEQEKEDLKRIQTARIKLQEMGLNEQQIVEVFEIALKTADKIVKGEK